MARIAGVTIPSEKQIHIALTYVYGIGPKFSGEILTKSKVEPTVRVKARALLQYRQLTVLHLHS